MLEVLPNVHEPTYVKYSLKSDFKRRNIDIPKTHDARNADKVTTQALDSGIIDEIADVLGLDEPVNN